MARKPSLAEVIEGAQAEAVALDATILELGQKEKDAVARAVAEAPGENPYAFGTQAEKHRKSLRKAEEDRERLKIRLDALAVLRAQEIANEANEALAAAVEGVRVYRPALEKILADAGAHMAALAEAWLAYKDNLEAFDGKVVAGRGLAAAAVTNLDARSQWDEAAGSLSDLGPQPVNFAYFVEVVLAAALDPRHDDEFKVNAMRVDVGIPDLRAFNVTANFSGDRLTKRGGSDFADKIQNIAVRNAPKPEPAPPTDEQLANAAAAAAEQEQFFQARRAHEQNRRGYVHTEPTWPLAPPPHVADVDEGDPTGLGLSEAEQSELAELQTR